MRVILKPGGVAAVAFVVTIPATFAVLALTGRLRATAGSAPVAYFPFSEEKGVITQDAIESNRSGQLMGSALWIQGVSGWAVHVARDQKQHVDLGRALIDTRRSFSVACWVKLDEVTGLQTFVSQDGEKISGFYLQKDGEDKFSFTRHSEDSDNAANPGARAVIGGYKVVSRLVARRGPWYHLAGVWDADVNTMKLYVNGSLEDTLTIPNTARGWSAEGHTYVGTGLWKSERTDFANASIDNVRLYQRTLSDAEALALYKARQ